MVAARRSYKIYADIGRRATTLIRKLDIVDTGSGPSFIWKAELAVEHKQRIIMEALPDIRDAHRNCIRSLGFMSLVVQLERHF